MCWFTRPALTKLYRGVASMMETSFCTVLEAGRPRIQGSAGWVSPEASLGGHTASFALRLLVVCARLLPRGLFL